MVAGTKLRKEKAKKRLFCLNAKEEKSKENVVLP